MNDVLVQTARQKHGASITKTRMIVYACVEHTYVDVLITKTTGEGEPQRRHVNPLPTEATARPNHRLMMATLAGEP